MNAKQFFLFVMLLIFLGGLTNILAFTVKPVDYKTEFSSTAASAVQSDSVQADLDTFPNLHPMVVHFPIVLLLLAVILQLIQLFVMNRTMDWVILLTIGSGFIGAYAAGTLVHPHTEGLTEMAKNVLEQHDKYAIKENPINYREVSILGPKKSISPCLSSPSRPIMKSGTDICMNSWRQKKIQIQFLKENWAVVLI